MKKTVLALLLTNTFLSLSHAQPQNALSQLLGGEEISVPLAPPPDRGEAIDYTLKWDPEAPLSYSQSPAELLQDKDGLAVIKTVRWGLTPEDHRSYRWETVTINAALLEKAVYAYKTYGTGHTLLVFTFKEGGAVNSKGESVSALTFGAEGWSREPKGYNITHALAGRYPLIWLVTSFESYADYVVSFKGSEIFFKNINIDRAASVKLLGLVLARIDETNRNREMYNLFTNSCTNNPVDLLNRVLPEDKRIALEVAGIMNPGAAIPKLAVKKFTARGALQAETFRIGRDNYTHFDVGKI